MTELFRQLAFINALLGGFAITFLSVLVTANSTRRILDWMVVMVMGAAACFIVSALGATFSAVAAANVAEGALSPEIVALRRPMSLLFLGGTALLFVGLGMTGWLRSRRLGAVTTAVALLALLGAAFMMRPFVN